MTIAGLMATLAASGPAHTQGRTADIGRASCADYMALPADDRMQLALWLGGYHAGSAQRAEIDLGRMEAAPAAIAALCEKAPQTPLIGAETRAVFMPQAAP